MPDLICYLNYNRPSPKSKNYISEVLQLRRAGGRRDARVRRRDDVSQQRQHRLHREAAVRVRSWAASAVPTGFQRLLDRRALHGRAEHLVGGDRVYHLLEGRRLLVLPVLVLELVAHCGDRLLRVGAHRALHARGRVDAVTGQDIVDPRQSLSEAVVFTCVDLIERVLQMQNI